MLKEKQIRLTEELVETSINLLFKKMALGSPISPKGSSYRLEFKNILNTIAPLFEISQEIQFQIEPDADIVLNDRSIERKSYVAKADLLINLPHTKSVVDFKFFNKDVPFEEQRRYSLFRNLYWLEQYKKEDIDSCWFILVTDNPNYVLAENLPIESPDFDCRDKKEYKAGKLLQYKSQKPWGEDFVLQNDYTFRWKKINDLYFLKLKF